MLPADPNLDLFVIFAQDPAFASAFQLNLALVDQVKSVRKQVGGIGRDQHRIRWADALDAAGDVHGVTPDIVGELVLADDAGREPAGVQADPHAPGLGPGLLGRQEDIPDRQGEVGGDFGVVLPVAGKAAGCQVGVPNGLDLLHAAALGGVVECRIEIVQGPHQFRCRHRRGRRGEVHQIGKDDRCTIDGVGNHRLPLAKAADGVRRQDVAQQAVGLFLLGLDLVHQGFLQVGIAALDVLEQPQGLLAAQQLSFQQPALAEAITESSGTDTVFSFAPDVVLNALEGGPKWPTGIGLRSRRNEITDDWHGRENELAADPEAVEAYVHRFIQGDENVSLYVYGQGAGAISSVETAADIMDTMLADAQQRLAGKL